MGWISLVVAGVLEVGFTTTLRLLNGMGADATTGAKIGLNVLFIGLIIASFQALQFAIRTIPMGMAYAVWTGIGAVGTVVVGALFFGERLDAVRLILLAVIVAAIVGLKLVKA
ncbi:Guanidinium exporter [Brevundimonas subvibrioides]|uniref:Guanidinium exporter n=1 Tax=Brevundimonas subvibrioides (strain ATCC 15264 / DSM 4735 / LMG 14903 / NBRC 16000 / CB 81) TaxID=633149 RepID=D9QK56_BRESC|nr:multidrug efflux SMR transporter [Brevundimonas subvibrioides]ADL01641.1 small multidrug resistance protein [Brevundimonas subvibrioides ATCC 15264]